MTYVNETKKIMLKVIISTLITEPVTIIVMNYKIQLIRI